MISIEPEIRISTNLMFNQDNQIQFNLDDGGLLSNFDIDQFYKDNDINNLNNDNYNNMDDNNFVPDNNN